MTKTNTSTATKTKGPAETAKGKMPPDHLARWKTSNLSFPANVRGQRSKQAKRATEGWKQMIRARMPFVPNGRLPANMRAAIADLLDPIVPDSGGFNSRRDKSGGESEEIIIQSAT